MQTGDSTSNLYFWLSLCRKSGNVIDLVKLVLGVGFSDACDWLLNFSKDACIYEHQNLCKSVQSVKSMFDIEKYRKYFEHPYLNNSACQFLFAERKLNPAVIQNCRITSWKSWLQIPYFDLNGNLIDVQWRNLGSSGPRFRFPSGSHSTIYNLPVLKTLSPGEELFIAEGCSDCWSLMSAGHKAIAIPSATLCNPQTIKELSVINSQLSIGWSMYPDADAAGETLFNKINSVLPITRHQLPSGCKDYSDYYLKTLCY